MPFLSRWERPCSVKHAGEFSYHQQEVYTVHHLVGPDLLREIYCNLWLSIACPWKWNANNAIKNNIESACDNVHNDYAILDTHNFSCYCTERTCIDFCGLMQRICLKRLLVTCLNLCCQLLFSTSVATVSILASAEGEAKLSIETICQKTEVKGTINGARPNSQTNPLKLFSYFQQLWIQSCFTCTSYRPAEVFTRYSCCCIQDQPHSQHSLHPVPANLYVTGHV